MSTSENPLSFVVVSEAVLSGQQNFSIEDEEKMRAFTAFLVHQGILSLNDLNNEAIGKIGEFLDKVNTYRAALGRLGLPLSSSQTES
jgi:hypothetical protein